MPPLIETIHGMSSRSLEDYQKPYGISVSYYPISSNQRIFSSNLTYKANQNTDDSKNDPIAPGNDLTSMLSSSSAADAKTDHLAGFTFVSPNPQLSPVNPPVFDAVSAMDEGIYAEGEPGSTAAAPRINDERPILRPTPLTQTQDLPVEVPTSVADPWEAVVDAWTATAAEEGEEMGRLFAQAWSDAFGWNAPTTLPNFPAAASSGTPVAGADAGGGGGAGTTPTV
jgi:hypothetical protein